MYITRFRDTVNSMEELDTGSVVIVVSSRPILFNRSLSLIKQATGSGRHLQMGDAVVLLSQESASLSVAYTGPFGCRVLSRLGEKGMQRVYSRRYVHLSDITTS